jgi:hypothetical protein
MYGWVEAADHTWTPFWAPLTLGKGDGIGVGVKTWPIILLGRCTTTMAPEPHGAQVLLDPDYGSKKCFFAPTKTLVCYIFGFIKFSPKCMVEAAVQPWPHFGPPYPWFRVRAGVGGQGLTKLTTGKVHYNFGLINFAWKWLAAALEAHVKGPLTLGVRVGQGTGLKPT